MYNSESRVKSSSLVISTTVRSMALIMLLLIHYSLFLPIRCRGIVLSSNSIVKFVVILYISFAVILLRNRARKLTYKLFECFLAVV